VSRGQSCDRTSKPGEPGLKQHGSQEQKGESNLPQLINLNKLIKILNLSFFAEQRFVRTDPQMIPFTYAKDTARGIFRDARAGRVPGGYDGYAENKNVRAFARSEFCAP